ncbi:(S)-beta-macrocarpene synthase-like [Dorcoceras hygrometricum]|uniref:(S)-beta-macrocarpene synthase-like n=1 Tax=Dorcoceras hygrometricum TaxID=472368 RepID=A0A2Z7CZ15_9LAMI|nr:(S)-beta-macrocarpene synthase-like [Dorcoceras hygrometricum]
MQQPARGQSSQQPAKIPFHGPPKGPTPQGPQHRGHKASRGHSSRGPVPLDLEEHRSTRSAISSIQDLTWRDQAGAITTRSQGTFLGISLRRDCYSRCPTSQLVACGFLLTLVYDSLYICYSHFFMAFFIFIMLYDVNNCVG